MIISGVCGLGGAVRGFVTPVRVVLETGPSRVYNRLLQVSILADRTGHGKFLTVTDFGGQWSRRTRRPLVPKLQLGDPLVQQHAVSW